MDTILGRYKNLIVLTAILFAQIIALAVQVRRPSQDGEIRLIRVWAIAAVTPLEKAVVHSENWVRDKWEGYLYLRNVRRENAQLRSDIEQMKLEQARFSEDAKMARRIQTLLAFKEQYIESTIAAQVIGTSGSEQSRVLYIDKGSSDGVKNDMAVITPTGIVGKVVQVSPGSAQVLPINDQLSGVGAALKDSRLQGILKGAANGTTTLQYIMSDEPVKPGETVITSGGDRIFPKGLLVGTVAAVEPGKDLFLNIRVIPSARLDRLEEVLVVTKVEQKLPDTKDLGPIRASDILSERLPGLPATPDANAAGSTPPGASGTTAPAKVNSAAGSAAPKPQAGGTTKPPATNAVAGANAAKPATSPASIPPKPRQPLATSPGNGTATPVAKPNPEEGDVTGATTVKPPARESPATAPANKPPATVPADNHPSPPANPPPMAETPPQ